MLRREVRYRPAQCPPRRARQGSKGQVAGLRSAASREAKGQADVWRCSNSSFRRYFEAADRKKGVTGETLLQLLEQRLDNVVYRLGFATSRPQARQLVRHGHFTVNGKRADIPSYSVRAGDLVAVRSGSIKNPAIIYATEEVKGRGIPEWLELDVEKLTGRLTAVPTRDQINLPVQEQLIVELYSK